MNTHRIQVRCRCTIHMLGKELYYIPMAWIYLMWNIILQIYHPLRDFILTNQQEPVEKSGFIQVFMIPLNLPFVRGDFFPKIKPKKSSPLKGIYIYPYITYK